MKPLWSAHTLHRILHVPVPINTDTRYGCGHEHDSGKRKNFIHCCDTLTIQQWYFIVSMSMSTTTDTHERMHRWRIMSTHCSCRLNNYNLWIRWWHSLHNTSPGKSYLSRALCPCMGMAYGYESLAFSALIFHSIQRVFSASAAAAYTAVSS